MNEIVELLYDSCYVVTAIDEHITGSLNDGTVELVIVKENDRYGVALFHYNELIAKSDDLPYVFVEAIVRHTFEIN